MSDERAKRNPEFDERNSTWITLADGGRWAFPKPWLEIHAAFRGRPGRASYPVLTYGPELEELVDAIDECRDNAALIVGAASLGAYLLRRNYDLSDEDLDRLFAIRVGDPPSWEWAKAVIDVATGTERLPVFSRWQRLTLMANSAAAEPDPPRGCHRPLRLPRGDETDDPPVEVGRRIDRGRRESEPRGDILKPWTNAS